MAISTGKSGRTPVGLELEPSYVAAADVSVNGSLTVERARVAPLAPGVLRDGDVGDVGALARTLDELFDTTGMRRQVRIGIANQRIVMRTLDLPPLTNPKELDSAVRFQAQEHVPMPLEQAVLDYHSLGVVPTADGERSRVVLVAVRRDLVERVLDASAKARLKVVGIDLSAFAMVRALTDATTSGEGAVLYVAVGGMTNLALAVGSRCLFTRAVPGGVQSIVVAVAERCAISLDDALAWVRHVGLETPIEQIEGDDETILATRSALDEGTQRIAHAVRDSLEFHGTQLAAENVERAILTGPAASVPGMAERLSQELSLPVVRALLQSHEGAISPSDRDCVAVAAGLAIPEAPGS